MLKNESFKSNKILIFTPLAIAIFAILFHLFPFSPSSKNEKWISFLSHSSPFSSGERDRPELVEGVGIRGELTGANKIALGQKIDINRATAADLAALPSVGPKLAEKIVADREAKGPFKNIDGLMRVKGIKEKKLEKLRPYIIASF